MNLVLQPTGGDRESFKQYVRKPKKAEGWAVQKYEIVVPPISFGLAHDFRAKSEVSRKEAVAARAAAEKYDIVSLEIELEERREAKRKAEVDLAATKRKKERASKLVHAAEALEQKSEKYWSDYMGILKKGKTEAIERLRRARCQTI